MEQRSRDGDVFMLGPGYLRPRAQGAVDLANPPAFGGNAPAALARGAHLHRHWPLDRHVARRPFRGDGAAGGPGRGAAGVLPAAAG